MATGSLRSLPGGTRLSQYELVSVLGSGGFGITYLGRDTVLDKPVAIKEYMPSDLAVRMGDSTVVPESETSRADFDWGLERFLDEARVLGRFRHENVVGVLNFMHQNGTAYIVMEHVSGETLAEVLKRKGRLGEAELRGLVEGLLSGLEVVHAADYLHRDIKPGNVILRPDGTPVLLDFGSARQSVTAKSRSVTAIVTPGYAPIEQYSSRGNQGPWTDIYAVGAICYRAMTGEVPVDATERVRRDPLVPVSEHPVAKGAYSADLCAAVDEALKVDEDARPQSVAAWRAFLSGEQSPTEKLAPAKPAGPMPSPAQKEPSQARRGGLVAAGIFAVVLGASGVAVLLSAQGGQGTQPDAAPGPTAVTAPEVPSGAGLDDTVAAPSLAQEETAPAPTVLAHRAYLEDAANQRFRAEAEAAVSRHEAAVLRLEAALSAKGFVAGNVDGRADLATARAIEAFRAAAGYSAPGVDLAAIDAAPIAALAAAVESWTQPATTPSRTASEPAPVRAEPTRASQRTAGEVFSDCTNCPSMIVVPAGSFTMGSPITEYSRAKNEGPQRTVTIGSDFAVGRYEVTWAEWDACVADDGCSPAGPDGAGGDNGWGRSNRPVIEVDWNDAQAYVSWLSRKSGQRYRLLSEAEWEYAARAGSQSRWSFGDDETRLGSFDWYSSNANSQTQPVGRKTANAFGLYDMHGNVYEWTQDCWNESYSGAPKNGSAWTSGDCSRRVVRGGSWAHLPRYLRSAYRDGYVTSVRLNYRGFRVARTL